MAFSENEIKKHKDKELYAYNPMNRFRLYERNLSGLSYYKFYPPVFKDKIIQQIKGLKIPIEVIESSAGWLRFIVPDEHKNDSEVQQIVSNVADEDIDEYFEKKAKLYSSRGWQVVIKNI